MTDTDEHADLVTQRLKECLEAARIGSAFSEFMDLKRQKKRTKKASLKRAAAAKTLIEEAKPPRKKVKKGPTKEIRLAIKSMSDAVNKRLSLEALEFFCVSCGKKQEAETEQQLTVKTCSICSARDDQLQVGKLSAVPKTDYSNIKIFSGGAPGLGKRR